MPKSNDGNKTGYCKPPIKNRFTSTNQPNFKTRPRRGASPTTELKKILEKKISYEDPETKEQVTGKIAHVIALRLVLNATQGENEAIKEVFNRTDGKISDILIDQSLHITVDKRSILENARKAFTKGLV